MIKEFSGQCINGKSSQLQAIHPNLCKSFYLTIPIFLGSTLISCNNAGISNTVSSAPQLLSEKQIAVTDKGIVTYYFTDGSNIPTYSIPIMNTNIINKKFANYRNKINAKRVIIKSSLLVNKSGEYQLYTSQPEAQIQINGINLQKDHKISLKAGETNRLVVNYTPRNTIIDDLVLEWIEPDSKVKTITPERNLVFPQSSMHKRYDTLSNKSGTTGCKAYGLADSSCNGIPDEWALSGYTVHTNPYTGVITLEKWDDNIHGNNPQYTKYFSAVYKYSTADDPYSDYQKVTGIGLDKAVSLEARNPLVAAVPIINATLDDVIISKNQTSINDINGNNTSTLTSSASNHTTDGYSNDVGGGINISAGWGGLMSGPVSSVSLSINYNHQWNHSSTVINESSSSTSDTSGWSSSLQMNNADAAYFLPILRYENVGTAPAYELAPTFNFMAASQNLLLNTVTAKSNAIANSLSPGNSYPSKGTPGILVSGADDFNSTPMKLNKQQLDTLEKDGGIYTYVTQISAKLKYFNNAGQPIQTDLDDNWVTYLEQSNHTTARFKLMLPDNLAKERRVAARNPRDPSENFSKPEVSLESALALIKMKHDIKTGHWNILNDSDKVIYELTNFTLVTDQNTAEEIEKQYSSMGSRDLSQIKLRAQMMLYICPLGPVVNKLTNTNSYWMQCKEYKSVPNTFNKRGVNIKNIFSNKYVSAPEGYVVSGANLFQSDRYLDDEQLFNIKYSQNEANGTPIFRITPYTVSSLVWDNSNDNDITYLSNYTGYPSSPVYTWNIYFSRADGSYLFVNRKDSSKTLGLEGCSTTAGVRLKLQSLLGSVLSDCPQSDQWLIKQSASKTIWISEAQLAGDFRMAHPNIDDICTNDKRNPGGVGSPAKTVIFDYTTNNFDTSVLYVSWDGQTYFGKPSDKDLFHVPCSTNSPCKQSYGINDGWDWDGKNRAQHSSELIWTAAIQSSLIVKNDGDNKDRLGTDAQPLGKYTNICGDSENPFTRTYPNANANPYVIVKPLNAQSNWEKTIYMEQLAYPVLFSNGKNAHPSTAVTYRWPTSSAGYWGVNNNASNIGDYPWAGVFDLVNRTATGVSNSQLSSIKNKDIVSSFFENGVRVSQNSANNTAGVTDILTKTYNPSNIYVGTLADGQTRRWHDCSVSRHFICVQK